MKLFLGKFDKSKKPQHKRDHLQYQRNIIWNFSFVSNLWKWGLRLFV